MSETGETLEQYQQRQLSIARYVTAWNSKTVPGELPDNVSISNSALAVHGVHVREGSRWAIKQIPSQQTSTDEMHSPRRAISSHRRHSSLPPPVTPSGTVPVDPTPQYVLIPVAQALPSPAHYFHAASVTECMPSYQESATHSGYRSTYDLREPLHSRDLQEQPAPHVGYQSYPTLGLPQNAHVFQQQATSIYSDDSLGSQSSSAFIKRKPFIPPTSPNPRPAGRRFSLGWKFKKNKKDTEQGGLPPVEEDLAVEEGLGYSMYEQQWARYMSSRISASVPNLSSGEGRFGGRY